MKEQFFRGKTDGGGSFFGADWLFEKETLDAFKARIIEAFHRRNEKVIHFEFTIKPTGLGK